MSKRTRHGDNSKRQQPIQQQRAQARLPNPGGPSKNANTAEPAPRQGTDGGKKREG